MPTISRSARTTALALTLPFALLFSCTRRGHAPPPPASNAALAAAPAVGVITPSPGGPSEVTLAVGDSAIAVASSSVAPEVGILVRSSGGRARLQRWVAGSPSATLISELPAGFEPRAIAAHPAQPTYFVSGMVGGRSRVISITNDGGKWKTTTVFETPREIVRLIVSSRPFQTDSGVAYRMFFATKLSGGRSSLRSVTEKGKLEYQLVGPASEAIAFPQDEEHEPPGGKVAPFGMPMFFHPRGEPLVWQDERGCAHAFSYFQEWTEDTSVPEIPCGGSTSLTPNGNAYLHWQSGRPGVRVIGVGVTTPLQATGYTFLAAPVAVADGRGVIGIVASGRGGAGRSAIAYVPLDIPLADVANAWQHPEDACDAQLFEREGGLFRDTKGRQLYAVYDRQAYDPGANQFGVPFLATTDLFWDNFGAAFNGVFILSEKSRAIGAFWAFVDSANAALSRSAPQSKWARAFAAISDSRRPDATGEAGLVARDTTTRRSTVVDSLFPFGELRPRGHYTSSPQLKQYFRAVHYLTEIGRGLQDSDAAPLASLPASVQRSAWRWIDVYRPFISLPRSALVWTGGSMPPIARYSKHPTGGHSVFPLSWGLDNEVLESTVLHTTWPPAEQIPRRLHPTGLDVATVYGNAFARTLLDNDLRQNPRLGPVLDGIIARRPKLSGSSSVYERWLDALGAEWADSLRFPGAPASSTLWNAKRLQTGLASWATLREATILVNERASSAEGGANGFEDLIPEQPRGYVEPAPKAFEAIASLYTALARSVGATQELEPTVRAAIAGHLDTSAARTRRFGAMAERELRGQALSDSDYAAIQGVAGAAEEEFLLYKSFDKRLDTSPAGQDEGIPTPDPMPKIADVAGNPEPLGVLEVAVGNPLEWRQIVPYFGRREIVTGGVYSYHEFVSHELYDNERWRKEVDGHPHPAWVQSLIAQPRKSCTASASR